MSRDTPTDATARRPGWLTLAAFGGLLTLTALVHWGLWKNLWYQDDWLWLRIARDVARSPASLFTPDTHNSEAVLRLTQRVVMALTYAVAGLKPAAYHVVSIVLHAVAATAVFRLSWAWLRRVAPAVRPGPWAALTGILYASSSGHAMAVQWAAAQSTLLCTIASAALLTVWIEREHRLATRDTWLRVIGLFLLALFSKNTAVALPLALAASIVLVPLADPRSAWRLCGALAAVAVVHVAVTKFLLPSLWGQAGAMTDQGQFALSADTANNLLGAVLGGFLTPKTYHAWAGPIPFQLASLGLVGTALWLGRAVGMLRPVALGLVWVVALAIPTALLDYRQYDPSQLTVSRYEHLPMVGTVLVMTFLAWGTWRRLGRPRAGAIVLVLLVGLHVGWHRHVVQRDQQRLRKWGDAEQRFLDRILDRAQASMPKGTTIYAVGWQTGDVYIECMDALVVSERGYTLAGQRAFDQFAANPRMDPQRPPWVGFYDAAQQQFGILPAPLYLQREREGGG